MNMKKILLFTLLIVAMHALADNKPYITRVYDFVPAPGQFVNMSPKWNTGDTREQVLARVEQAICGRDSIEEGELPDGTIVRDTKFATSCI